MSSDRIPMTRAGYDKLKAEADQLEIVEMPKLAQRVAAARTALALAEQSLDAEQRKFTAGTSSAGASSTFLVIQAQNELALTQNSAARALADQRRALANYDRELGATLINRPARILQPGMVLTIEPGIYVRPAPGVPEQFHNIGIRIEDDAIVTPSGCELISRGVPVEPDAIETLMRS